MKTTTKRKNPTQAVALARRLGVSPHTLRQRVRSLRARGELKARHRKGQRWEFAARDLAVIRAAYQG